MAIQIIKQNVGVDLSKDDFKACFRQLKSDHRSRIKASRTFKNTSAGFRDFVQWVQKHRAAQLEVRFTLEATGVYYEQLAYFLFEHSDFYLSIVLPNQAKAYAKSLGLKTKTDKVDAQMLGQMGLERDLKAWKPISSNLRTIKQLTRERVSLIEEKTSLSNKLHALRHSHDPSQNGMLRLKQRLDLIKEQIKQVEKQVKQQIALDESLKERIDKVCQVKGLGLVTVATIVAETGGFVLFTNRSQLTSYAGYDVVHKQSGSSINGKTRISKKGNRFIRRALFWPSFVCIKYEPHFKKLYDRVYERSAMSMKASVAVQRKLLLLIYTLFKNDVDYQPDHAQKNGLIKSGRQDTSPAYTG